ncbi:MAG: DNA polymerase III subunit alpha [Bacteroides sp.]|nr:DNA polymerase III subunit alpha [Eubacterium sp.]MCM1417647.1 DNA polymerase III subunit alpha [Roseburia sp.]MCM1461888.1 DNA polymerase III subunit alpha [Bacteroides sp.]
MFQLHTHSYFSLGDSIIRPSELVDRLKEIGQTGAAITDHGNLYAGVSIYKLFKKNGLKYVHGIEFYICDDLAVKDKDNKYYHLIALAKNEQGRVNMNRLVSLSNLPENKYHKPRIDFSLLSRFGDGLIICSACMAGEIAKFILTDHEEAKRRALRYKTRFGEDYYIEIQSHNDPEQIRINQALIRLAKECGIEVVVTCDAHYVRNEDRPYQNVYAFGGAYAESGESYIDCFVQSEEEVRERLSYLDRSVVDRAIENTDRIADHCQLEMPLSAPIMPDVNHIRPKEYIDNASWLQALCENGCLHKLGFDILTGEEEAHCKVRDPTERRVYLDRFLYELDSLKRMGFVDYILLVYTYANVGKRKGPGRGSGGGSLINYLTDITDIDPIEHKLMFERFIDVGAIAQLEAGEITAKELKIPDIDLDFSGEDCERVLKWLRDTYGDDNVASIGRFGNVYTKSLVRDIGKLMGMELQITDAIAKSFSGFEIQDIDRSIESGIRLSEQMQAAYQFTLQYPKLFEYVRKLYGLPKSFGKHPCGKIISTRPIDEFLPSCYDTDGIRFLQGDEHDVEDVGLVKVDILGLRTLDQEYDTLLLSGEEPSFVATKQKMDDERVYQLFRSGDTVGIFQFSSEGMKKTLRKMNPTTIEDLSAANAMFRPGPMANIDEYCERKAGKKPVTYLHPDLEPILKNTCGILVFQEQLIEIGKMAGVDNPDRIRKGTAKKNKALLDEVEPELKAKLEKRGWTKEQTEILWEEMKTFGSYAFNKSHSSAYAILAYMTAKQKAYYPAEFFAGLLNSYIGESNFVKDVSEEIFADIACHKITYETLSFRNDHRKCSVREGKLVYAIPLIKELNTETAAILWSEHDYNGRYFWELLSHLYQKGLRKSSMDILIGLDFFAEFGNAVKLRYILNVLEFFDFGSKKQVKKSSVDRLAGLSDVVAMFSTDRRKDGSVGQSYREIDVDRVLNTYEGRVKESSIADIDIRVKIANQQERLGIAPFPTGKQEDRPILFVRKILPLCRKADGKQFGYSVYTSSLGSGIQSRFSIKGAEYRAFRENPIAEKDVIRCLEWKDEGGYPVLKQWKQMYV